MVGFGVYVEEYVEEKKAEYCANASVDVSVWRGYCVNVNVTGVVRKVVKGGGRRGG
jgi:hypothetical protein